MDDSDFHECCVDEIALEGLDGITLEALWTRLQNRPRFPLAIDDASKEFIWRSLIPEQRLQFYKLPEPRVKLVIYDRYQHLDPDSGYVVEPDDLPEDPYPPKIINEKDVRGSCSTFYERVEITDDVRRTEPALGKIEAEWGNTFVMVASQATRERAVLGVGNSIQDLDMTDFKYAMLERIGRSRYLGQTSQGRLDLSVFKGTASNMFLQRKRLLQRNLITKQEHYQKDSKGVSHTGSLMHLPRFYVERQTKMQVLMQQVCETLAKRPNKCEVLQKLRADMGMKEGAFKKLVNAAAPRYLNVRSVTFKDFFPTATEKECYTKNKKMRILRVVELIKPYKRGAEEEDEEDHNEEEEDVVFFQPKKFIYNRTPLHQAYKLVREAGTAGITQRQIQLEMTSSRVEARAVCKGLVKRGVVVSYIEDVGRQRVARYFTLSSAPESDVHKKYLAEKKRMMEQSEGQKPAKRARIDAALAESGPSQPASEENTMESSSSITNSATVESASTREDSQQGTSSNQIQDHPTITVETDGELHFTKIKSLGALRVSFTNGLQDENVKSNRNFSYKTLMRANNIIEFVRKERLVSDRTKLLKFLQSHEAEAGYKDKLDRVSLERLVFKLCKEGYIKSIRTILRMGSKEKSLQLICHPDVTKDDEIIKTTIEQARFKYFAIHKETKKPPPNATEEPKKEECQKMPYDPQMSRFYGAEPKFRRMQICYVFIHYMVYSYSGSPIQSDDPGEPIRYHKEMSWKTFVPPLPKSPTTPDGWCLFSDVLLSLPLSVFVKVVSSLRYKIEGIEEYLQDDVKQHYLVRSLPVQLRNALLYARRYIYSIHETIKRLSYVGLLTFGPQRLKEKDQVHLYIHRKITIKDTTVSRPGYHQVSPDIDYPIREYFLQTQDEVCNFWMDVEQICLRTPLGTAQTMRGQTITLQNLYKKPDMVEASRNREFDEVVDDGKVPGDQLGAAGFDSALFPHLKRNWSYMDNLSQRKVHEKTASSTASRSTPVKGYMDYLNKTTKDVKSGVTVKQQQKQRLGRLQAMISRISVYYPKQDVPNAEPMAVPVVKADVNKAKEALQRSPPPKKKKEPKPRKSGVVVRVLRKRTWKRTRRPYYDEKDREALKLMKMMRVSWTSQEDIMLLFCKVASLFLDPHQPKMVVPFCCIRDIMHEYFPDISKDKTSRACQRRLHFMLLNPTTAANVSVFLCEARRDKKLTEMFHGPKPPKSAEEQWAQMLRTVIEHLREKFSKRPAERLGECPLPPTLDELKRRYEVMVSGSLAPDTWSCQEPHNVVDIHFNTVSLVVMSSFAADDGKSNWSLLLYRIYEQYPDKLIRSVSTRLKYRGVVTKKKNHAKKQLGSLSMSALPFILSTRFHYDLNRRFLPEHFAAMGDLLTEALAMHQKKEKRSFAGGVAPPHAMLLCSLMVMNRLEFSIEVPQTVVEFDERIVGAPSLSKSRQCQEKEDIPMDGCGDADKMRTSKLETSGANVRTSRSFLYMLRQDMNKALEFKTARPQDYVVIKPCTIECAVTDANFLSSCTVEEPKDKSYRMKLRSAAFEKVVQEQRRSYSPEFGTEAFTEAAVKDMFSSNSVRDYAPLGWRLYSSMHEKKEMGAPYTSICAEFLDEVKDEQTLRELLEVLVEGKAVAPVGVSYFRYVTAPYCKPWMVKSFKIPKELRSYATTLGDEVVRRAKRQRLDSRSRDGTRNSTSAEEDDATNVELRKEPMHEELSRLENGTVHDTEKREAETSDSARKNVALTRKPSPKSDDGTPPEKRGHVQKRTYYETASRNLNFDSLEKTLFVPRLWKKPDGSLNRAMFHRFLSAVLSHVMDNPGITEEELKSSFLKYADPSIQVLDALNLLEMLSCVERFYVRGHNTKRTFFSKREDVVVTNTYRPGDKVCYEATLEAMTQFAAFSTYFLKTRDAT